MKYLHFRVKFHTVEIEKQDKIAIDLQINPLLTDPLYLVCMAKFSI